jgi:phosphoglycolate phosphatase
MTSTSCKTLDGPVNPPIKSGEGHVARNTRGKPTLQKHIAARPDAVIFDLDGTIADTAADIANALNAVLADMNLPPYSVAQTGLMIGRGPRVLIERALRPYDRALEGAGGEALVDRFKALYAADVTTETSLYEGVRGALDQARARRAKIGLCTNKPDDPTQAILRNFDIASYFSSVVAGDSGLPMKPDPAPLLHALRELGAEPSRSVMVGDSISDVRAARAAGIGTVIVVAHGYSVAPPSELGGDLLVDRIDQLGEALDRFSVAA